MKSKKFLSVVAAFLMVGVSLGGITQAFADGEEPVNPAQIAEGEYLTKAGSVVGVNFEGLADGHQRSCTVNGVNGGSETTATCAPRTGEVTVNATGAYTVVYNWCTQGGYTCPQRNRRSGTATIVAYDVIADASDPNITDDIVALASAQLQELAVAGETYNDYLEMMSWTDIWDVLVNMEKPQFVIGSDIFNVPEDAWEMGFEAEAQVRAEIKDTEVMAALYGGFITINAGDTECGLVRKLDAPTEMRLAIPEEHTQVPSGVTRSFYVIRGHATMGQTAGTATRITPTLDGDDLIFDNDEFSSFVIVYEDEEDEQPAEGGETSDTGAPDTGVMTIESGSASSSVAVAVAAGLTAVVAFGVAKFAKRK